MDEHIKVKGVGGQWENATAQSRSMAQSANPDEDGVRVLPLEAGRGTIATDIALSEALCVSGNGATNDNLVESILDTDLSTNPNADTSFDFLELKHGYHQPGAIQTFSGALPFGDIELDHGRTLRDQISRQLGDEIEGLITKRNLLDGTASDNLLQTNPFKRTLDSLVPTEAETQQGGGERETSVEHAAHGEHKAFFEAMKGTKRKLTAEERRDGSWANQLGLACKFTRPSRAPNDKEMNDISESLAKADSYANVNVKHDKDIRRYAGQLVETGALDPLKVLDETSQEDSMLSYQRGLTTLSNRNFKKLVRDKRKGNAAWYGDEISLH